MKISIVIPAYNELKTIQSVIESVEKVQLALNWEKEIIIVDDGSTDGTKNLLESYKGKHTIHFREKNGGKGAAIKTGFSLAKGDYILIQDADLEYDPNDYPKLLSEISSENQVVFGSRVLGNNNVPFSKFYYYGGLSLAKVFNVCFKTKLTDITTCYKVFPTTHVEELIKMPNNDFVFDVIDLTYYLAKNATIVEVPIFYKARTESEGKKINWRHGVRCFNRIIKLYYEH